MRTTTRRLGTAHVATCPLHGPVAVRPRLVEAVAAAVDHDLDVHAAA